MTTETSGAPGTERASIRRVLLRRLCRDVVLRPQWKPAEGALDGEDAPAPRGEKQEKATIDRGHSVLVEEAFSLRHSEHPRVLSVLAATDDETGQGVVGIVFEDHDQPARASDASELGDKPRAFLGGDDLYDADREGEVKRTVLERESAALRQLVANAGI